MPKTPKSPRHEAAIAQSEQLLQKTAQSVKCPAFFRDADHVIQALRKTRPRETRLALHLIAVAVGELLDRRHTGAKMALLMAQGLAEPGLTDTLMHLFCAVFHRDAPCEHDPIETAQQLMKAIAENSGEIMALVAQGGGKIELPGGIATIMPVAVSSSIPGAPVHKQKSAKKLPPPNPWN